MLIAISPFSIISQRFCSEWVLKYKVLNEDKTKNQINICTLFNVCKLLKNTGFKFPFHLRGIGNASFFGNSVLRHQVLVISIVNQFSARKSLVLNSHISFGIGQRNIIPTIFFGFKRKDK